MACRELNARERKRVYMHSTIFDNGGPSSRSIYAANQQTEINRQLGDTIKPAQPPCMDLPRPQDMQCTQNAGHGVVLPSKIGVDRIGSPPIVPPTAQHVAHKWYKDGECPRVSNPEVLVNDGDPMPVTRAGGKDRENIPQEFWQTSVNLEWHDPRNEMSRRNKNRNQQLGAQDLKLQELSSEVFGKTRMTNCSTMNPGADLLSTEADYLQTDSSLNPNVRQARHEQNIEQVTAYDRFTHNLGDSEHFFLKRSQQGPPPAPPAQEENPSTASRRRQEKNFSDLFGTNMGERKNIKDREELIGTRTCSFLDTRSEIAARNKDHWKVPQSEVADKNFVEKPHIDQLRKEAELTSQMFDRRSPQKPRAPTDDVVVTGSERACWDTRDMMEIGSEVARRGRTKDFQTNLSAQDRKHNTLASQQVRRGMGGEFDEAQPQFSPRGGSPRARGQRITETPQVSGYGAPGNRPMTAKETKLAALQSSIFN